MHVITTFRPQWPAQRSKRKSGHIRATKSGAPGDRSKNELLKQHISVLLFQTLRPRAHTACISRASASTKAPYTAKPPELKQRAFRRRVHRTPQTQMAGTQAVGHSTSDLMSMDATGATAAHGAEAGAHPTGGAAHGAATTTNEATATVQASQSVPDAATALPAGTQHSEVAAATSSQLAGQQPATEPAITPVVAAAPVLPATGADARATGAQLQPVVHASGSPAGPAAAEIEEGELAQDIVAVAADGGTPGLSLHLTQEQVGACIPCAEVSPKCAKVLNSAQADWLDMLPAISKPWCMACLLILC